MKEEGAEVDDEEEEGGGGEGANKNKRRQSTLSRYCCIGFKSKSVIFLVLTCDLVDKFVSVRAFNNLVLALGALYFLWARPAFVLLDYSKTQ